MYAKQHRVAEIALYHNTRSVAKPAKYSGAKLLCVIIQKMWVQTAICVGVQNKGKGKGKGGGASEGKCGGKIKTMQGQSKATRRQRCKTRAKVRGKGRGPKHALRGRAPRGQWQGAKRGATGGPPSLTTTHSIPCV